MIGPAAYFRGRVPKNKTNTYNSSAKPPNINNIHSLGIRLSARRQNAATARFFSSWTRMTILSLTDDVSWIFNIPLAFF